jgi:excisionase family DNA binding protein
MQATSSAQRKPSSRVTIAPEARLLVSREEAAQLLSISPRGLDYLIANRRLPTRRIGGRVLIPVADLRKYARGDHQKTSRCERNAYPATA